MKTLEFEEIEVSGNTKEDQHITKKAKLAVCGCGSQDFVVYKIEGFDHFHIQCSGCDTTFCPYRGTCDQEIADGVQSKGEDLVKDG